MTGTRKKQTGKIKMQTGKIKMQTGKSKSRKTSTRKEARKLLIDTIVKDPKAKLKSGLNISNAQAHLVGNGRPTITKKVRARAAPVLDQRHVSEFFASHGFTYSGGDIMKQFSDLAYKEGWTPKQGDSKEQKEQKSELWGAARNELSDAIAQDFNIKYGMDVDDVQSWRGLCEAINLQPIPEKMEECRKAVAGCFVNIIDLVERPRGRNRFVQRFDDLEKLRTYTIDTKRFFPKENAYAGGVLRYLLREILGKYEGNQRDPRQNGGLGRGRGRGGTGGGRGKKSS